jgi:plastocyanin
VNVVVASPRVSGASAVRPIVFGWRALAQWSAALAALILFATAVALQDREAAGVAVVALVGLALVHYRRARLGLLILAGVFTATLGFMLPGAASNLAHGQGLVAYLVPLSLTAVAASGLIATVVSFVASDRPGAPWVAVAIGVAYAIALSAGLVMQTQPRTATPNELAIAAKTNAFSTTTLAAQRGQVTVRFANQDLFWHTFTIDALGVDLKVPVNAEQEVAFEAAPGVYEFYCAIPGHALVGMKGTLVVD